MKSSSCPTFLAACATLVGFSICAIAADKPASQSPQGKPKTAAGLKWRVQQLHLDNNEGCAVADFNKDGKPDIAAGEFWYAGPDFKEKKPLRKIEPFGKDYLAT